VWAVLPTGNPLQTVSFVSKMSIIGGQCPPYIVLITDLIKICKANRENVVLDMIGSAKDAVWATAAGAVEFGLLVEK